MLLTGTSLLLELRLERLVGVAHSDQFERQRLAVLLQIGDLLLHTVTYAELTNENLPLGLCL